MKESLSEQLQGSRADRPDEWTMDRWICMAKKLEGDLDSTLGRILELERENQKFKANQLSAIYGD